MVGGIIQFGMIFWAQNTLTQVVRDTGRWAATQQGCALGTTVPQVDVAGEANKVAGNSSLLGYTTGEWAQPTSAGSTDASVSSFTGEGIAVAWVQDYDPKTGGSWTHQGCPPKNNQAVYHVTIRINHAVPLFFPGMQYLPAFSSCDGTAAVGGVSGPCALLSSTAQFRMEPAPNP